MDWQRLLYSLQVDYEDERLPRFRRRLRKRFDTPYIRGTMNGNHVPLPLMNDRHLVNTVKFDHRKAFEALNMIDNVCEDAKETLAWTQTFKGRMHSLGYLLREKVGRIMPIDDSEFKYVLERYFGMGHGPCNNQLLTCKECDCMPPDWFPLMDHVHQHERGATRTVELVCRSCWTMNEWVKEDFFDGTTRNELWNGDLQW